MKPCFRNRKRIASLALHTIEARESTVLREHLSHCAGCRAYWEELVHVAEGLAAAAPESHIEASEMFHRRVAQLLRRTESPSALEDMVGAFRRSVLSWRAAMFTAAGLAVAFVAAIAPGLHPRLVRRTPEAVQVAHANSAIELAPTRAIYQIVASQSVEKFEQLLTREGNKPLPSVPAYTPSGLVLANSSR